MILRPGPRAKSISTLLSIPEASLSRVLFLILYSLLKAQFRYLTMNQEAQSDITIINPTLNLDRLCICYDDDNVEAVNGTCNLLIDSAKDKPSPFFFATKTARYRVSCRIPLPLSAGQHDEVQSTALFETGPFHSGQPSYRLEFNPARLSQSAMLDLLTFVNSVIDQDDTEFFRCGRVTRCDIAVDFSDLHIADVIVRTARLQKHGIYSDRRGNPETIYLGTPRSRRVVAYEKSMPGNPKSWLRLECRLKPRCLGHQMAALSNPFAKVELLPADFAKSSNLSVPWEFIADSFRIGGLKRALRPLCTGDRKMLRKAWHEAKPAVASLEAEWQAWPTVLTSHGLGKHLGALPSHFTPSHTKAA